MIKLPPNPPFDVMRPPAGTPTLGSGVAARVLPNPRMDTDPLEVYATDFPIKTAESILQMKNQGADRREILEKLRKNLAWERRDIRDKIDGYDKELADLKHFRSATLDLMRWQKAGLRLERATSSNMHHLLDAMAARQVRLLFAEAAGKQGDFPNAYSHLVGASTQAFVVEHDWSSAFEGASEFAGDDFQLPYGSMCFEFRISGRNVCAMMTGNPEYKVLVPFVHGEHGWVLPKFAYKQVTGEPWKPTSSFAKPGDDEYEPLRALICGQIRAICISLEAEVSTTEVIRASYKLNRSRAKHGRAPVADYHVIRLAHRHRILPRSEGAGDAEPGVRKRLHFRRGHWRHFSNHRTWIKWTLVGDPDLGFIDKHYRL